MSTEDLGAVGPRQDGNGSQGETRSTGLIRLLGPAFIAAVAYVDPGNIAANVSAGATYGYLLVWVLVAANIVAVLVQYLSAKLGVVTGTTLPELLGARLRRPSRLLFWGQAEIIAAATDLAEVIGGAIALQILFGVPLLAGGVIVTLVSLLLLSVQSRRGQRPFEFVVIGLLAVITIGFLAGLALRPPDWGQAALGLIPHFEGSKSVLLAASMVGATVMPHAIYLHSSLVRDRHGHSHEPGHIRRLLRATRWDVSSALALAGTVNIGMLLLAATALPGAVGTETIEGAAAAVAADIGPVAGVLFGVGLLASGLASTSVGCYAGSEIMAGLIKRHVPLALRRAVTSLPALVILAIGWDPTWALVLSQALLSLGIPFALIPLIVFTRSAGVMGRFRNGRVLTVIVGCVVAVIIALNIALVALTVAG